MDWPGFSKELNELNYHDVKNSILGMGKRISKQEHKQAVLCVKSDFSLKTFLKIILPYSRITAIQQKDTRLDSMIFNE